MTRCDLDKPTLSELQFHFLKGTVVTVRPENEGCQALSGKIVGLQPEDGNRRYGYFVNWNVYVDTKHYFDQCDIKCVFVKVCGP